MLIETGILRRMQSTIVAAEPGTEKDHMQARFDLMVQRLDDYPRRVADRGPFADRKAAESVLRDDIEFVLAAMEL